METFDMILWIAIIVLILLPPSLDPAIRIKMRQIMKGTHPESRGAEWVVSCRYPNGRRFYLCLDSEGECWTRHRSLAARFSSSETAERQVPALPEHMKRQIKIEIA